MAATIQFRFPECQKIEFSTLIPRASESGLQLLDEFLYWDAEKRPSAQQALKYPFFQIMKRGPDAMMHSSAPMMSAHQQQHIRHQNQSIIGNDRMLNMSSSEQNDLYPKENSYLNRNFSTYNNHSHHHSTTNNGYQQYNGARQTVIDSNNQIAKDVNDYLSDVDEPLKRTKHENGINSSVLNGEFNNFTPSINNNYQSEISAEDATSEHTTQSNTYNSTNNVNKSAVLSSMAPRNFPSSIITQPNNYKNTSITLLNDMKNLLANGNGAANEQRRDFLNGFNSRRNSRASDENALLHEKISDIFVNRNPGKLYNNNNSNNYANKMANGDLLNQPLENGVKRTQEYGYKNKSFYLHDNSASHNGVGNDAKVYNIFSKQRMTKPIKFDPSENDDEENSYLLIKMPSAVKKKPLSMMLDQSDSFEDDELDKLLG